MRWVILVLLVLVGWLQYRFWEGEGGLREVRALQREIASQREELARSRQRNQELEAEVQDLKTGLEALEERARTELGMIREGEVLYHIVKEEAQGGGAQHQNPASPQNAAGASPAQPAAATP